MSVRAVVVDPTAPGRLAVRAVSPPEALSSQALVRVQATSLNPGESRRALRAEAGWRPGWDIAGVVERAAADGDGPAVGARVVGKVSGGGWCELVPVETADLAEIPDGVTTSQAACLPIAGLTSLRGLEQGGFLLERNVLITGASGSVGTFACQLARLAGARVTGLVRRPERSDVARGAGAHEVVVGDGAGAASGRGPFDLILESLGGDSLGAAMSMLARDGICVFFGTSASNEVTFDPREFYLRGGGKLYGLALSHEGRKRPLGSDLAMLCRLVGDGRLRVRIDVEDSWHNVGELVRQQVEREVVGKIVMRLE